MDFDFSDVQQSWREKAQSLGAEFADAAAPGDVVMGAARAGLIDPKADLVAAALAVEGLACSSALPCPNTSSSSFSRNTGSPHREAT